MICEIGTIIGSDGRSSSLTTSGTIVVYRRYQGVWNREREMPFLTFETDTLAGLRDKMKEVLSFLGDCRIFAADNATGALYFELMKAGCSIFEVSGTPEEFLEDILAEEEKEQAAQDATRAHPVPGPYERAPGAYVISIKDIQGKIPGITSKQILLDFLKAGRFSSLEITCDHIPPWIEMESEQKGFRIESERRVSEVMVRVVNPNFAG